MVEGGSGLTQFSKRISIVITGSHIPSHPSTAVIDETIESLRFIETKENAETLLAHDGIRVSLSPRQRENFFDYVQRLSRKYSRPPYRIALMGSWGHLSQTLLRVVKTVSTEYVLVMQHDLPFIKSVDLDQAMSLMDSHPQVKHLRFNKRRNEPDAWDAVDAKFRKKVIRRDRFFFEQEFRVNGQLVPLVRTLAWTDQNFLCRKSYFDTVVGPLVGRFKCFPERIINPQNSPDTHEILGTYVWGHIGDDPVIRHADGQERTRRTSPRGLKQVGDPRGTKPGSPGRSLARIRKKLGRRVKKWKKMTEFVWLRMVGSRRMSRLARHFQTR